MGFSNANVKKMEKKISNINKDHYKIKANKLTKRFAAERSNKRKTKYTTNYRKECHQAWASGTSSATCRG